MKRDIAQLVIERESHRADEKNRANHQKSDLALKQMESRSAGVQAKKEAAAALKDREIKQKQDVFEKRKQKANKRRSRVYRFIFVVPLRGLANRQNRFKKT